MGPMDDGKARKRERQKNLAAEGKSKSRALQLQRPLPLSFCLNCLHLADVRRPITATQLGPKFSTQILGYASLDLIDLVEAESHSPDGTDVTKGLEPQRIQ